VASAPAFDAVSAHILQMADALPDGIMAQFPTRFEPPDATDREASRPSRVSLP